MRSFPMPDHNVMKRREERTRTCHTLNHMKT
jgi:hypothetical protein